jgi:CO/xanthine dehydrogenase Mo-binding subunit
METHLDFCAAKLGLDPIEVRRRNLIGRGGTTATGQNVGDDAGAADVLERALDESAFLTRRTEFDAFNRASAAGRGNPFRRRGIGLALFMHGTGLNGNAEEMFHSTVRLRGNADGTLSVLTAQVEIGQGTQTILAQLAAEGAGIPVEWVTVEEPDTAHAPDSGPTVASRTAAIVGDLLISAGRRLRDEVERHWGGSIADPETFRSALVELAGGGTLETSESFQPPPGYRWDKDACRGDAYLAYTWSCCVAALEVDTLTGEVTVLDVTSVHDVGKVVHPLFAAGQVEGGVVQGLGWTLMERDDWDHGVMQNANMTDYPIPTSADVPRIRAVFVEHPQLRLQHGAKGLGEVPMEGPAPAVANALRGALGIDFHQLPLVPEIILPAWEDRDHV